MHNDFKIKGKYATHSIRCHVTQHVKYFDYLHECQSDTCFHRTLQNYEKQNRFRMQSTNQLRVVSLVLSGVQWVGHQPLQQRHSQAKGSGQLGLH